MRGETWANTRLHTRGRALLGFAISAVAIAMSGDIPVSADPCGMVPPMVLGDRLIERIDIQRTYVCYSRGIESIVLRPGFRGRVEDFGMLIPFPQPPEVRKVDDRIFAHIAAAIDPPEVTIDLTPPRPKGFGLGGGGFGGGGGGIGGGEDRQDRGGFGGLGVIRKDEVAVLKEEAVGMYEVAVLAAGSAESLNTWMSDHGYRYPEGMDEVCNEYIEQSWGFVAVKTRVAAKAQVDPQPGQRAINAGLPNGARFEGHVQAMGFRFFSDKLVVPMRLSAFNAGPLRNVVYLLTQGPKAIRHIPEEYVVRQIAGKQLTENLTELLPVRIIGGETATGRPANGKLDADKIANLTKEHLARAKADRDPEPYNGLAKDLIAADLLAIGRQELLHSFEVRGKQFANISASLGLNDAEVSRLYETRPKEEDEQQALADVLDGMRRMFLTVIDGDFPREVLASENLQFKDFYMSRRLNNPLHYDAMRDGPGASRQGALLANVELSSGKDGRANLLGSIVLAFASVLALGLVIHRLHRRNCTKLRSAEPA